MTREERAAMRELGYRWNYLKGQHRHRWQNETAFIWQLNEHEGAEGKWVGRRRIPGNMHQGDVHKDIRNWRTYKLGPTDSPVQIATLLALQGV